MQMDLVSVSSKGQIVLPISMRNALAISEGDKLAVYTTGDIIMLKPVKMPTAQEFEQHLDEAKAWAASVGYTENDVNTVIKEVRGRKKNADRD